MYNFDNLGPANWLWGKQYEVYANVDTDSERYIEFERWWGDFIQLNGDELQFLVDHLFIGDELVRNEMTASDGTVFDVRNITSPIIVFTSTGDNISPPPQALGWVADCYRDVADIQAIGQTIVYCMSQKIGHLALFVSSKVGAEQDEEFVQLMDVIDCLPPGLYEMVITPRPSGPQSAGFGEGKWMARFEHRTLDDIRALGRNSAADDRAFAAVARISEMNLSLYSSFMRPWVRLIATQKLADAAHTLNPLRLCYTMFADSNPWMKSVQALASLVSAHRAAVGADNPLLVAQGVVSKQIVAGLDAYRAARDQASEQIFFGIYGSRILQAWLGLNESSEVRPPLLTSPERLARQRIQSADYAAKVTSGGRDAALVRAVLYVIGATGVVTEHCALALNVARKSVTGLSLAGFKALVREQAVILALEPARAMDALAGMVPDARGRRELLAQAAAITGAVAASIAAERDRMTHLAKLLPIASGTADGTTAVPMRGGAGD